MVSRVLLVIIFTGRHLPPAPPLRVLKVHLNDIMCISIHITESEIHVSCLKHHDSTLMFSSIIFTCHPFHSSSISLFKVGNTFSISSPFDDTKLQNLRMSHRLAAFHSQCQWIRMFLSLTPLWRWGLNLDLNDIESVVIPIIIAENYGLTLLSVNILTGHPSFISAKGAHKRKHGCNYSHHRVYNTKILIRH